MEDSSSPAKREPADWGELALFAIAVLVVLSVAVFLFLNRESVGRFFTEANYQPLSISTSPSGAVVILDGKDIGTSPVTVRTAPGPHTLVVRKAGFKEQSFALNLERDRYERGEGRTMKLVRAADPWIVNLELEPQPGFLASQPSQAATTAVPSDDASLESPVESTASPQLDQVAKGSIDARMSVLEQRINATNERVDFAVTLELAIIAIVVAIFLALGVQIFVNLRK